MDTTITRRDFVQGVATSVAASVAHRALPDLARGTGSDTAATQDAPGYYPPALTGLRGSGPGSFEVAHGFGRIAIANSDAAAAAYMDAAIDEAWRAVGELES